MVGEVSAENPRTVLPKIEIGYDQLDPAFHRAVERIVTRHAGWVRIDGLKPEDTETVREILKSAQGQRLPTYRYVRGDYLPLGETYPIEERHTRFSVAHVFEQPDGTPSLGLEVPIYSEGVTSSEPPKRSKLSKKEWAAVIAGGLAGDSLFAAGIATERVLLATSGILASGSLALYAANRLMGPSTVLDSTFSRVRNLFRGSQISPS